MTLTPPGEAERLELEIAEYKRRLREALLQEQREDFGRLAVTGGPGAFAAFVRWAWPIVEPGTELAWNWHHELACAEVQVWLEGKVRDLVINMPPGYMKSLIVSVMGPAYGFLHAPHDRSMYVSGSGDANKRDSRKCRDIILNDEYQALAKAAARLHGHKQWGLKRDQQEKLDYSTTEQGHRKARPLGGKITSMRGNRWVVDDPHDVADVTIGSPEQVTRRLDEAWTRVSKVLTSRLNNQKTGGRLIMMQRLHERDVAGRFIAANPEARVVCFPVEYDPEHPHLHPDDPRTEPGELLHPEREGPAEIERLRADLGPAQFSAQYNQRPVRVEGGLFRRSMMLQTYAGPPVRTLGPLLVLSCDLSFKGSQSADFVALGVVAVDGTKRRPVDVVLERLDFMATQHAILQLVSRWRPHVVLVEDKANGPAILSALASAVPGLVAFSPDKYGSKYARAQVLSSAMQAGQWEFPDPNVAPWLGPVQAQLLAFPDGANDDAVDMWSQLEIYVREWHSSQQWGFT